MTLHFSHDQGMGYGSQGETEGSFQDNSIKPCLSQLTCEMHPSFYASGSVFFCFKRKKERKINKKCMGSMDALP
jgi:hypothetical protein